MKRPSPLTLGPELLEDRTLPSSFGTAWADPGHLTLSFVPNGTTTPGGPSSLGSTLAGFGSSAAWQREVLRAFQTWAVHANVNIGLVSDGGQALGTTGAVQGDARFGDVRVAAGAFADDRVAFASPFSWTGTTFAGDVVFNSAKRFQAGDAAGGFDLFSIALHEAGHAFGLRHTPGTGTPDGPCGCGACTSFRSVMDALYARHTALAAEDVANIQALYGARTSDRHEGAAGNGTLARATGLGLATAGLQPNAVGDLTTASDVDVFKFTNLGLPGLTATTVRVRTEGLSLLLPKVTVYDSAGRVVASAASTDVRNNDVTVRFSGKLAATYFVKVEGATEDVFSVGAYQVAVDTTALGIALPPLPALVSGIVDGLNNETIASATSLIGVSLAAPDARFDATYRGVIESRSDVDVYRVRVPQNLGGAALNVIVWAANSSLNPRVRVLDAGGNEVAFRVLANDTGLMSVRVENPTAGVAYHIEVSARTPGAGADTGGYVLGADFGIDASSRLKAVGGGTLSATTPTDAGTLAVTKAGVYQFGLFVPPAAGGGSITLTVTDASGAVVFTLTAEAGKPAVTAVRHLAAGTYTFRYSYRPAATATPSPLTYHLGLLLLSDDAGTYATKTSTTSPSGSPPPPPPPSGDRETTSYSGSTKPSSSGTVYSF